MRRSLSFAIAVPALFLCTLAERPDPPLSVGGGPPAGVTGSLSRATPGSYGDCGPGARPEPGLQGQVPQADQLSGASKEGYRCNLRLVGENSILGRGANFQMGWYRDCAYVGSVGVREYQSTQGDELDGVAVIDASNPRSPQLVRIVRAPSGLSQHEGIEVNAARGMLVVTTGGLVAPYIDIYDVSQDCRNPVFKARYDAGYPAFHGLRISPDGRTVYATDNTNGTTLGGGVMQIIDLSDMSQPRLIMKWDPSQEQPQRFYGIHDLDVNADGTRAYLGAAPRSADRGIYMAGGPSNTEETMVVLDTSDIQQRRPNPDPKVVSSVALPNFGHTEQRATIGGKPYIFTSGETPFAGGDNCPWAWGNAIDISDERAPRVVGEIKLEVNEEANCAAVGADEAVYSIHYIGVDDVENTSMVFYTYYTGGVRVFDVRDPARPREIAYYHPPPVPSVAHPPLPGSMTGDYQEPEWDSATSDVRYFPERRQLWFVSIGRGFQVLELGAPVKAPLRAIARLVRQRRAVVLRRRAVKVRVTCSAPCRARVRLRAGRGVAARPRWVRLPAAGSRTVRLRLNAAAVRKLRRGARLRVSARAAAV